jgi:flagellar basal body-associated protein FliL
MRLKVPDETRAGVGSPLLIAAVVVVLVAVALGLAAAYALSSKPAAPAAPPEASAQGAEPAHEYVPFGTTVVNLAGGRLTRYLQVTITLEVEKGLAPAVKEQMEAREAVFKNWLITFLSDKQLEEVEGGASIRRLRREVQDGFNAILAEGAPGATIHDVYFEEFNVQ